MSNINPILGRPGVSAKRPVAHKIVAQDGFYSFLPGGGVIDGTKSRDWSNTDSTSLLQPGLPMGKVTSGGKYAPAILGVSQGALTSAGTTLTVTAAQAAEIYRRIGATGTFTVTGPPTAAGTVRSLTATYSAIDTVTGAITITALGVNEVQTVNLVTAGTAGNLRLIVQKTDGTFALTPNIAWNATDATVLSNANTALDTATGVAGGIVATAIAATDTDLGLVLTYSGTGYAGNTWALAEVHTMFTSNTGANVVRTTTGVDGRMIAGAFVGPTDGSQTPITVIPDGWGIGIGADSADVDFPQIPTAGLLRTDGIIGYPSDTSLIAWLIASLNRAGGGLFQFASKF